MERLKTALRIITPKWLQTLLRDLYFVARMLPNVIYDTRRFIAFSGINRSNRYKGERVARIVMTYHQIEKGLSLSESRPGFGKLAVQRLLDQLEPFLLTYGVVPPATTSLSVLHEYLTFNDKVGYDVGPVRDTFERLVQKFEIADDDLRCWSGGTVSVTRKEIDAKRNINFTDFFNSRHSVRQFTGEPIPDDTIREAVALARKTPSVCNRQAWRVHSYGKHDDIERLLEIQEGSRGFGHQSSVVFVVTCDLNCFVTVAERYQAWIDGGMFSMSLCLAFHSLGYGTCCLNWSKERAKDIELRKAFKIPEAEQIIMLIAVGSLPDTFTVACSSRISIDQVLQMH